MFSLEMRTEMKLKAVLFDLDGTLLPMDQEVFIQSYFKHLARLLAPLGVAALIKDLCGEERKTAGPPLRHMKTPPK